MVNPAPASRWPNGSPTTVWRSPERTPGATGRYRPRTRPARSPCPSTSTFATACSSSRTSTPRRWPRRHRPFRPRAHPPQAPRRQRRVDITDRARLTGQENRHETTTTSSSSAAAPAAARSPTASPRRASGSCSSSAEATCRASRRTGAPRRSSTASRYMASEHWYDKDGAAFRPHTQYFVGGNTKVYGASSSACASATSRRCGTTAASPPPGRSPTATSSRTTPQAERLYLVHGQAGEDPTEPPRAGPFPYPAVSHEPRIQQLHDDLERAGPPAVSPARRHRPRRIRPAKRALHSLRPLRRLPLPDRRQGRRACRSACAPRSAPQRHAANARTGHAA